MKNIHRGERAFIIGNGPSLDLSQYADEISNLFCRYKFTELQYTSEPIFQTDPKGAFWQGYTVTYVALQLAFIMGFETVYLVGMDHNYGEINGNPNEKQKYSGDGHADGLGYDGGEWNLPDLDRSYQAYEKAQRAYANAGRKIYIVPPTSLDLFEEVSWKSLAL